MSAIDWILRSVLIAAVVGMAFAGLMMHRAACDLHVWAVDRMSNTAARAEYQGAFYRYCRFINGRALTAQPEVGKP